MEFLIGFGAANALFSIPGYFLVESDDNKRFSNLRGRRNLLMISLGAGAILHLATGLSFNISDTSSRLAVIVFFIILFTYDLKSQL